MAIYQSRDSQHIYNLDRFVKFYISNETTSGPGIDESKWQIIEETESGNSFVLYSGTHPEAEGECKNEFNILCKALQTPTVIALSDNTIARLNIQ